jgi:ATP-dependent exoDNAse (exonuclease V) beta subunit
MNSFYHIAARAGAGTGKTFSLVENYRASLLGTDPSGIKKRPQQILALTFTQKAAHEMRLRVAVKLNELLSDNNNLENYDKDELRRILRALPNATIATFHSFCANLLRQEAQALGLDDQFAILLPHEERRLAKNILRPLIINHIEKQDPAIRSLAARFRLSQGLLSSGLINGLLECYYKLAELGVYPGEIRRTEPRIDSALLSHDIEAIKDALASLKSLAKSAASKERVDEIQQALDILVSEFNLEENHITTNWIRLRQSVKGNFGDKEARQKLVSNIICFGTHLVDYFVYTDELAITNLLRDFHECFDKAKLSENKLSYADLLLKTRDALASNKKLRRRVKLRFEHILIDEYQDTSPLQEQIIALIAENKNFEADLDTKSDIFLSLDFSQGASLFVVGDKKQSIYGFRGANTTLFDRMINKMSLTHKNSPSFTQKLLTINRRSQKNILELVNLTSQINFAVQGYSENEHLEAWHSESTGITELWLGEPSQASPDNAKTCASGIAQLLASRDDLTPNDIVVLVRRIKAANPIKEELALLGISARIVGGDGFFQQQEIVDLIAALKLVNNPAHELASAIVLRSALILLEDNDLLTITANSAKLNLNNAELALNSQLIKGEQALRLKIFLDALEEIRKNILYHDLSWALDILINRTNLAFNTGIGDAADQAWANINKLCSMASGGGVDPFVKIEEYFEQIFSNLKEGQALGTNAEHLVTIMTIHQSKGLEFKVVILADCESPLPQNHQDFLFDPELGIVVKPRNRPIALCAPQGREEYECFPTRFDRAKIKLARLEDAELTRLLYVALTRAREELYIVASKINSSPTGPTTLLRLFLRAGEEKPTIFGALCPVKYINYTPSIKSSNNNLIKLEPRYEIFKPQKVTTRYFSSQLEAPPAWEFLPPIHTIGRGGRLLDGNLAHHILGQAGAMLRGFSSFEDETLKHLINASFRAQPAYGDQEKAERTLKACLITLKVLAQQLEKASNAIFEMPLFFWHNASTVIEGFADLVLDFPDFIGVVEFKSSRRLAIHNNTYLQILAYAQALASKTHKPVKYAVLLVGSSNALIWQNYDTKCRQALNSALLLS